MSERLSVRIARLTRDFYELPISRLDEFRPMLSEKMRDIVQQQVDDALAAVEVPEEAKMKIRSIAYGDRP